MKSFFIVTQNQTHLIKVAEIPPVPIGGSSLPIEVNMNVAPHSSANLLISVGSKDLGIRVVPDKLEFIHGAYLGYFVIKASNKTTSLNCILYFSLEGYDSNIYSLPYQNITFSLYYNDTEIPAVKAISLEKVGRNTAKFLIGTNKVCIVYYAFALQGTLSPSHAELEQGGPPTFNTTETFYGYTYVYGNDLTKFIDTYRLKAQTNYVFFAMAKDLNGKLSGQINNYNFTTLSRYNPIEVYLWFQQTYLTPVEVTLARQAVALVLRIHPWRVIENLQVSSANRMLSSSTDTVRTLLRVYVVDSPANDFYKKPKEMINMLIDNKSKLASLLTNFDSSKALTGSEIINAACRFKQAPSLLGTSSFSSIAISATLFDSGIVYGVAVPTDSDTGKPFSAQIAGGLDRANRATLHAKRNVQGDTASNLTFTGLQGDTYYNVYITCGNVLPGYPDLLDDENVYTLN